MLVTLYSSSADPRDIFKGTKLTTIATVDAEPFYPINITKPMLRLTYDSSYALVNYCYIPEFGRYYFVHSPVLESGSAMIIQCNCDVLMSFRADILELDCICTRNEFDFNPYIQDDIPTSSKATTTCYKISGDTPFEVPTLSGYYYALTLNGLVGGT